MSFSFDIDASYQLRNFEFDPWAARGAFAIQLAGTDTTIEIELDPINFAARISFLYLGSPYTFVITKWSGQGMRRYLELFHGHSVARPAALYGHIDSHGVWVGETQHKRLCVLTGCVDVMICLSKIISTQRRMVLDYAVWYREKIGDYETYSRFITMMTCHNIVHSEFMSGDVTFTIVEL